MTLSHLLYLYKTLYIDICFFYYILNIIKEEIKDEVN